MKEHVLDIYPEYFWPVVERTKNFEIRRNRENFQVGDTLLLLEFNTLTQSHSGNTVRRTIEYITDYAQKENYVVLGIK